MEACFFNTKSEEFAKKSLKYIEIYIKKAKYISKAGLQYSFLNSSLKDLKKVESALEISYNFSISSIIETLKSCKKLQSSYKTKSKNPNSAKSEQSKILLIQRALPVLEALKHFINTQ